MKKLLVVTLLSLSYILWSCNQAVQDPHAGHNHGTEEHNHDGHDHSKHQEHNHDKHEGCNHDDEHNHDHDEHSHDDHDEYGLVEIQKQDFQELIRTSGQILAAQGDEFIIAAIHDGIVFFDHDQLLEGNYIEAGKPLFSISGENIIHDNINATYRGAKASFNIAKQNHDRSSELFKEKIITEQEYLKTKLAYEKALATFDAIRKNYSDHSQVINASKSGYIKELMVSEGQFVQTGQALMKITKNKRLMLRADVPQRYYAKLSMVSDANFQTLYSKEVHSVSALNGTVISFGKTTSGNSVFTPIFFEIDNVGKLISGSFVEVFLKGKTQNNCIVIPKTAVLEEVGKHYVYIQHHDSFEKQYIEVSAYDGVSYLVASGLKSGDKLVTQNPYTIKLASMSNALPAHSHQH